MKKGREMRPYPRFGAVDRRAYWSEAKSAGFAIVDCSPARGKRSAFSDPSRLLKVQLLSVAAKKTPAWGVFFVGAVDRS